MVKIIRFFFWMAVACCWTMDLAGQSGDICSSALTVNLKDPLAFPCDFQQLSTSGLDFSVLNSNTFPGTNPACNYGSANNDLWLKVQVPTNSDGFNLSINDASGSSNDYRNFSAAVFTGSGCGSLTYVSCQRGSQLNYFRYFDGFSANITVYVRIYRDNTPSGTYTDRFYINMAAINTINSNDICSKAKGLVANTYCNNTATGKNEPSSAAPDNLTGTNNVCGASGFGSYENNQWYFFEVGPTTIQPVSVSLTGVNCTGTNPLLQTALWKTTAYDCSKWATGYNLTNATVAGDGDLIACALGIGSVKITKTLPLGKYWFTVDGSRGSFCSYTINTSPAILPIYVINFQVKGSSSGVEVNWTSLQSQDVDRFVVERSQNGIDFEEEGEVVPKSAFGMASFNYFIAKPFQGSSLYFRLKSIAYSGEVSYSKTVSIQSTEIQQELKFLYFDQNSQILVFTSSFKEEYTTTVQLINLSGQEIMTKEMAMVNGTNQLHFLSNRLSKGLYFLVFPSGGQLSSQKLVVSE